MVWTRPFQDSEEVLLPKYIEEVEPEGETGSGYGARMFHWSGTLFHSHAHKQIPGKRGIRMYPRNFEILATDISRRVLKIAEAGNTMICP